MHSLTHDYSDDDRKHNGDCYGGADNDAEDDGYEDVDRHRNANEYKRPSDNFDDGEDCWRRR